MSLEINQEFDTSPIISPTFLPNDGVEVGLRPKLLSDYTGQEKAKGNLQKSSKSSIIRFQKSFD